MNKVIIIGGGIAGLISAIQLIRADIPCLLIEKKSYPLHRVCGEYISNEAVPFLKSIKLYPSDFSPSAISRLILSSPKGKYVMMPLKMGGFGISRYTYDNFLFEQAKKAGVQFMLETEVTNVDFLGQSFSVKTNSHVLESQIVVGAFGKRSKLDVTLNRSFSAQRSPYVGVKYHLKSDHPRDLIALHNFAGGYCGVDAVENGITNLCYLTRRENLKQYKTIDEMEKNVLFKNPFLKSILSDSDKLTDKPETINEISFASKSPIENNVLMIGDAAGMITPLCGNGMAMAIHSAKIASDLIIKYAQGNMDQNQLREAYSTQWKNAFARRLWAGRQMQKLFGSETTSAMAINLALYFKPLAKFMIQNTHGKPF